MGKRRLPWRCKNAKQAKDKSDIYNSREWKELRIQKLRANPICEECEKQGIVTAAHCVHHRHPIEDSHSVEEMRKWAFMPSNLQSLCDHCHHRIHEEMRSFSRESVKQRADARLERWEDNMMKRFRDEGRWKMEDG